MTLATVRKTSFVDLLKVPSNITPLCIFVQSAINYTSGLKTTTGRISIFLLEPPPLSFFVLSSQSPMRGGSSNLIPEQQVCTSTEDSTQRVGNQRKWSRHFQSQGNNGDPTGGTAGNALALFPPAVVSGCLLTTHDAANGHCFPRLRGREPPICLFRKKNVIYFTLDAAFHF